MKYGTDPSVLFKSCRRRKDGWANYGRRCVDCAPSLSPREPDSASHPFSLTLARDPAAKHGPDIHPIPRTNSTRACTTRTRDKARGHLLSARRAVTRNTIFFSTAIYLLAYLSRPEIYPAAHGDVIKSGTLFPPRSFSRERSPFRGRRASFLRDFIGEHYIVEDSYS